MTNPSKRITCDGFEIRVLSAIDDEARVFESELCSSSRFRSEDETVHPLELNFSQTIAYVEMDSQKFLLIQAYDCRAEGQPKKAAYQAVLHLHAPKKASWYVHATMPSYGSSFTSGEAEEAVFKSLPQLLEPYSVCKLRLMPYRTDYRDLLDMECRARRHGFELSDPLWVTRTMLMDISGSSEDLIMKLDKKTRAKIKHASRASVDIVTLTDEKHIPRMREALMSAFKRTNGNFSDFSFENVIKISMKYPDRIRALGLFMKSKPEELMAYLICMRHDHVVEGVSSGSYPDPELRKIPFNYFIHWDMIQWGQSHGARLFDFGGLTDGGKSDPLAGISNFKRRWSDMEREVGREFVIDLAPNKTLAFNALSTIKRKVMR